MRPGQQQQQNKRMRGRGRKGTNPMSRSYESNGPDVKIRGNAQHIAEKYIALARDATASGDRVMAENYLQHAEHYGRIVAAAQGTFQLQRDENDFDGDYDDESEDAVQENGAPNGHPYPVPERAGGDRPQHPNQTQNNRDRDYSGGRDFNRDNQNRDNQNNREQRFNRDDRRDNRDGQVRDGQGREFQGRNRDRNRDFNRDRNQNQNGEDRRPWENRGDRQNNWQERNERPQTPGGLGPQPFVGEMPVGDDYVEKPQARTERNDRGAESRPTEAVTTNEPTVAQESGFGQAVASPEILAEPEGSILAPESAAAEPRRRTRQRRPRYGEGEVANAQGEVSREAGASETASAEAPAAPAVREAAVSAPAETAPAESSNDAPPAKRPRGRPRKKKPEDEATDGDAGHVPDFLLASNG